MKHHDRLSSFDEKRPLKAKKQNESDSDEDLTPVTKQELAALWKQHIPKMKRLELDDWFQVNLKKLELSKNNYYSNTKTSKHHIPKKQLVTKDELMFH